MKVDKYRVLGELIEKIQRQFVIPVYQRNYDWEKNHCKKLYEDIVEAYKRDRFHFIGSIVYVDQGEENKIQKCLIIDGQQRITTIFLLLKAMLDLATDEYLKKELSDILFNVDKYNNLSLDEQTKIKLKPIKSDNDQFLLLMKNDFFEMDKSSSIYINYSYLKSLLTKSMSSGLSIKDVLYGLKMLNSAVIMLDPKEDEPQVVFESINSTGLELSLADLIRNYILMTDKDQDRLFEDYWVKIEKNVGTSKMPIFITDYLQFSCKEMVFNLNAYTIFKNNFISKNYTNETMLQELLHYSEYYSAFLYGNRKYSYNVNKVLAGLRSIDQTTIYQFMFHVFDDYENKIINEETLEKGINFYFNYLLRRIICGVGSNSLRGLYKTLYNRIFLNKNNLFDYYDAILQFFYQLNTKDSIPSDSQFKDSLINLDLYTKKNVCKYVLKSIENSDNSGQETKEIIDVKSFSIEHIMPQTLNDEWKKELGANYEKIHEKYLHNLGNLTLTGYNTELGQKSFAEKKQLIEEKSHIVVLNKDVLKQTDWNDETIRKRADRLSGILLKIFAIDKPLKDIKFINNLERTYSLSEDFDLSGTKPSYFILMGIRINVKSYSEMLSKIITTLYDLDNSLLEALAKDNYKLPNATRTYITNNQSLLRKPTEIEESGIYFENNLNSNNIITFLKNLFELYELDYSELLFSVNNDNEDTENIKVGKLSEIIFDYLSKNNLLKQEEINHLMDKDYSKLTFKTYYPVLALNREDNRGNSEKLRYKKEPYIFNDKKYYLTNEWFDENKQYLINWARKFMAI